MIKEEEEEEEAEEADQAGGGTPSGAVWAEAWG